VRAAGHEITWAGGLKVSRPERLPAGSAIQLSGIFDVTRDDSLYERSRDGWPVE